MFESLIVIQLLGIASLFSVIVYLFNQKYTNEQYVLTLLAVCGLINMSAYLCEMLADNKETALVAVKMAYVGKVFIPWIFLIFINDYCRIRFPRVIIDVLFGVHCIIILLVFTCDYHNLYYNSITYTQDGIFPHLVLGHGVIYYFYAAILISYMLIYPITCIKEYFRRTSIFNSKMAEYTFLSNKSENNVTYDVDRIKRIYNMEKKQLLSLACVGIVPLISLIMFYAGILGCYDSTSIGYLTSCVAMTFLFKKYNLFSLVDDAKGKALDKVIDAYVIIDTDYTVLYFNSMAKIILPFLRKRMVLSNENRLPEIYKDGERYNFNGRIYEKSTMNVEDENSVGGLMIEFKDMTESIMYSERLEKDVDKKTNEIGKIQFSIINSLATMVAAKDEITGKHIRRTSSLVKLLSNQLLINGYFNDELNKAFTQNVAHAAPLHDIGKIAITDNILCKKGKLTPEEYKIIQKHAEIGGKMIEEIMDEVGNNEYLKVARDMAYYHHERWDGSGYPKGLKGLQIPLAARIMAVCDVYEALTAARSYKEAIDPEEAFEIIMKDAGIHFDPDIVKIFVGAKNMMEKI